MFSSSNALGYISFTSCPLLACVCGRLCVLVSRGALGVFVCGLILYSAVRPPTCWATGPEVDCRIQVDQWSLGQHTTDRAPRPALSGLCCLLLAATAACPSVGSVWFARSLHVCLWDGCGEPDVVVVQQGVAVVSMAACMHAADAVDFAALCSTPALSGCCIWRRRNRVVPHHNPQGKLTD